MTQNCRVDKFNLATGGFVGSIGGTTATTGTCPAAGAAPGWCTGGTFACAAGDGSFAYTPNALAIDTTNGFLFVSQNYQIDKFNLITGAFIGAIGHTSASTGTCPAAGIAPGWCTGGTFINDGSTDGGVNQVWGMAADVGNNYLYTANMSPNRINKINLATGAFIGSIGNTTATFGTCPGTGAAPGWCTGGWFNPGSGDGMFNWSTSVAVDPTNGFLYVTDKQNSRVQKFNLGTGAFVGADGFTTASTGTCPTSGAANSWCTGGTFSQGSFDGMFTTFSLTGMSVDTIGGYLYTVDTLNYRVQKIQK